VREELSVSLNAEQRALLDRLAPHFGFRSGVALVFAVLAGMVAEDELRRVAQIDETGVRALRAAAKELTTGENV
jgi:hypothetical protein